MALIRPDETSLQLHSPTSGMSVWFGWNELGLVLTSSTETQIIQTMKIIFLLRRSIHWLVPMEKSCHCCRYRKSSVCIPLCYVGNKRPVARLAQKCNSRHVYLEASSTVLTEAYSLATVLISQAGLGLLAAMMSY